MSEQASKSFADGGKGVVQAVIGLGLLFAVIVLITNLANAQDTWDVVLALVICGLVIGLQIYYLLRINANWSTMSTGQKWKTGLAGVFVPFLAVLFGLVLLAIAIVFLFLAVIEGEFGGGSRGTSGAAGIIGDAASARNWISPGTGEIRNAAGRYVGYFDQHSGQFHDAQGKRTGWLNPDSGQFHDRHGKPAGWLSLSSGEITNAQGKRTGWFNPDNGEIASTP